MKLEKLRIVFTKYTINRFSVELVNNEKFTENCKWYCEYQFAWQYFDVYMSDDFKTALFIP